VGTTGIIKEIETTRKGKPDSSQAFYEGATIASSIGNFCRALRRQPDKAEPGGIRPERRKELEEMARSADMFQIPPPAHIMKHSKA